MRVYKCDSCGKYCDNEENIKYICIEGHDSENSMWATKLFGREMLTKQVCVSCFNTILEMFDYTGRKGENFGA